MSPELAPERRREWVKSLEKHVRWVQSLRGDERMILEWYEDVVYPEALAKARMEVYSLDSNENKERRRRFPRA